MDEMEAEVASEMDSLEVAADSVVTEVEEMAGEGDQ